MEKVISKYISHTGNILAIKDFFGPEEDEVINFLDREGNKLTVRTSLSFYDYPLHPGDYLVYEDGSGELIKPKEKE